MITFILLATLLVLLGAALIVVPLVRPLQSQLPASRWTAIGACVVLAAGSPQHI